jgi:hypothetical protein
MVEFKYETLAKLRPLAQLFVALEFNSSKYYKYSCGLNFRAPRFDLKLLVLQRSQYTKFDIAGALSLWDVCFQSGSDFTFKLS